MLDHNSSPGHLFLKRDAFSQNYNTLYSLFFFFFSFFLYGKHTEIPKIQKYFSISADGFLVLMIYYNKALKEKNRQNSKKSWIIYQSLKLTTLIFPNPKVIERYGRIDLFMPQVNKTMYIK